MALALWEHPTGPKCADGVAYVVVHVVVPHLVAHVPEEHAHALVRRAVRPVVVVGHARRAAALPYHLRAGPADARVLAQDGLAWIKAAISLRPALRGQASRDACTDLDVVRGRLGVREEAEEEVRVLEALARARTPVREHRVRLDGGGEGRRAVQHPTRTQG